MKKFKEAFLREVLRFNDDEVKLTLEAQKKFPSLLAEEGKGFCVDGRTLHKILEVSKQFSEWMKNVLENSDAKENEDYIQNWVDDKGVIFKGYLENTKVTDLTGEGYKKEYMLTLDIAKEIAMFAGASNRANGKLKANSKLVRKYFLLMEKAIKGIQEHTFVREPEKENYNKMKEAILSDYKNKQNRVTKDDEDYLMIRESNMINLNLLGYTASDVRRKLGYMDRQTREHLEIEKNRVIDYLQMIITGLVIAGVEFSERDKIIKNICDSKYSHLKMN